MPPLPAAPGTDLREFEAAYRAHFAFAWRSLRRLGVPERDLPDATQEVFMVVHKKLPDFDARSRLSTWVYAICLRIASDRRRRASNRYEVLAEGADPLRNVSSADPAELGERRALLEMALDALSLEQRAVFTLFELEGMTGEEIAALLEIPAPTVHSRLRLAREAFRRTVERARVRERFELVRIGEETP